MAFAAGQTVGEYEILSVLGAGGMGQVYRVRNIISNRVEAMKVLLPNFTAERDLAARFIAEIRTLASLDHPNIAQLHTAFQVDNQLVMMMEFVEGFTLEQRAKQGAISANEVIEYTLQILSALSYAHSRGVVHRDIKPANIIVTPHGVVKLMDFGIAKSRSENQLTQPGTTMGSVYYMSPEQVRGDNVDARSDLYSVGILLYELLSGKRPFVGDATFGILNQQLNSAPRPPMEVNPALGKQLNDLILMSLAKDPEHRFQSADAFANALRATAGKEMSAEATVAPASAGMPAQPGQPQASAVAQGAPAPRASDAAAGIVSRGSSSNSGGKQRVIWVSVGAFAVVALLAAAAIGLPHFFRTGASSRNSNPPAPAQATDQPASQATSPADNQAASATPAQVQSTPATSMESAPAVPSTPEPTSTPAAPPAVTQPSPVTKSPAPHKAEARPQYMPDKQLPAATAPATPPASPAPAVNSGPTHEEVEQAHDRKVQLESRSAAVSTSLDNLRRQQEASGYSLRQDIAGAASRMNTYLQAADADMQRGDIAAAQHDMDRADKEISILEAFFHK